MRAHLAVVLTSGLLLAGCGQDADSPGRADQPGGPDGRHRVRRHGRVHARRQPGPGAVPLGDSRGRRRPGLRTSASARAHHQKGKVYLLRNTNKGMAVSTHLGAGEYENHTCVYGASGRPEGWFADIRWTAANGDVLLATSDFLYWTGTPGQSVAVDSVRFQNGGTGRFRYAEGEGMCYVNAPERTAVYDGTLRYGKRAR